MMRAPLIENVWCLLQKVCMAAPARARAWLVRTFSYIFHYGQFQHKNSLEVSSPLGTQLLILMMILGGAWRPHFGGHFLPVCCWCRWQNGCWWWWWEQYYCHTRDNGPAAVGLAPQNRSPPPFKSWWWRSAILPHNNKAFFSQFATSVVPCLDEELNAFKINICCILTLHLHVMNRLSNYFSKAQQKLG